MSLREHDVHVTSPCPIDLDQAGIRGPGDRWHCGHCSKTVHVLSAMTESQARAFLAANDGSDVCVSYAMSKQGEIRFRPEPPAIVPTSALVRRPRLVAAAALGLSMAACAPHENPRIEPTPIADTAPHAGTLPTIPFGTREAVVEPAPEVMVAGGLMAEPVPPEPPKVAPDDVQVDGGMRALPVAEPCDPPKPTTTMRGRMPVRRPAAR